MKAHVKWTEARRFIGGSGSGIIAILNKMLPLVEGVVFELKAVRTDSPQRYSPKFTHSSRSPATCHWKKRKKRCP